jgi:predicted transcriptional regulator
MKQTEDILAILTDEQSRKIIELLSKTELTIRQLANLLDIPQSTAYRKVRNLEELQIIKKTKVVRTIEGQDESYYRNWAYEIVITFRDGVLSHQLQHVKMENKIIRLWQKFSE